MSLMTIFFMIVFNFENVWKHLRCNFGVLCFKILKNNIHRRQIRNSTFLYILSIRVLVKCFQTVMSICYTSITFKEFPKPFCEYLKVFRYSYEDQESEDMEIKTVVILSYKSQLNNKI